MTRALFGPSPSAIMPGGWLEIPVRSPEHSVEQRSSHVSAAAAGHASASAPDGAPSGASAHAGDTDALLPQVYEELRRLAKQRLSREGPGLTLQPTALVHEA